VRGRAGVVGYRAPMPGFGSVITAMVTPFHDDGAIDLDGAAELARWLVEQGNEALVVTGTTGEASCLDDEEQVAVWRVVREAVDVPVLAGSGTNDTRHAGELTARAADAGIDAVLAVTPYYNRPSQAGIENHFRHVAASTDLPVLLYDIPVRTGRKISTEVILRLAREVPNIVGLKDAAGSPAETARVIAGAPEGFVVYSGDDALTLPLLSVGAQGVVGVATHWAAPVVADMIRCFRKGDVARAAELNARLIESWDFETGDANPNPVPTKAMLRALGRPAGPCRPPMGFPPEGLEQRALEVYGRLYA
jgi:4-hydroxy-tetrahydrodipicolinate synthase